jgi:hypothetical protein
MKKFYSLSVFCFLVVATLHAQPTITYNGNAPQIGDIFYTTGSLDQLDAGPAGPNQTWSYPTINPFMTVEDHAVDPSTTPYANIFTESNISMEEIGWDTYTYATVATSGLNYDGVASLMKGETLIIHYSNPVLNMQYPFSYNNSFSDTYFAAYEFMGTLTHSMGSLIATADAWGSITTPDGTFNNVLRVTIVRNHTDSTWMGTTFLETNSSIITDYEWHTATSRSPIFKIKYTQGDQFGDGDTSAYYTSQSIGIPESLETFENLRVFPNPASDNINISFSGHQDECIIIKIFNQLGQEVKNAQKRFVSRENQNFVFNLEGFIPGIYFICLSDANRNVTARKIIKK